MKRKRASELPFYSDPLFEWAVLLSMIALSFAATFASFPLFDSASAANGDLDKSS